MNGTQVNTPYEYNSQYPLDTRLQFDTIVEMAGFDVTCLYDGCISYCKELRALFMFDSNNQNLSTYGKWRYISTGCKVWTIVGNGTNTYTITDGTSKSNCETFYDVANTYDWLIDFAITSNEYCVINSTVTPATDTAGGKLVLQFNQNVPNTVTCKVIVTRIIPDYCC